MVVLENASYDILPEECKKALFVYADVERQSDPVMRRFRHQYRYRLEIVNVEEAKRLCMALGSPEMRREFSSFDDYHRWYVGANGVPDHGESRWPCIRSGEERDAWLTDGWHRFHAYVRAGDEQIPVLTIL